MTTSFLMARRLVEAGARYVSLNFSRWDWHSNNFDRGRTDIPMLDNALTSLVEDLHERGLDKDVTVVCWGEFGRTPKINGKGGRDHWGGSAPLLLYGGGLKMGHVVGASTKDGGEPASDRVTIPNLYATIMETILDVGALRSTTGIPAEVSQVVHGAPPIRALV